MKVDHVFGGHIYVLSSFGAARNPIYKDDEDLEFFIGRLKKYLEDICDIYAYGHEINQFQYLVRIKDRPELEKFYHRKREEQKSKKKNVSHSIYDVNAEIPPDSYLIFSQEVSNCLNSYAKRFNFKHRRKGGLFGDRYSKHLVESEAEMNAWIEKLNRMEKLVFFDKEWKVPEVYDFENRNGECSSIVYYENKEKYKVHGLFVNFVIWIEGHLRGCFECLPPKNINGLDFLPKYNSYKKIKGFDPPW